MIKENGVNYVEDDDVEPSINELKIGASGWCVPWALSVDSRGGVYLRGDFTFCVKPGGTVNTLVTRVSEDSFRVRLPARHKFVKGENPNENWEVFYNLSISRT